MQNIVFYVAANEPLGIVKDYANAKNAPAPTMVLGAACQLRMRLFANAEGLDAYPIADLAAVTSWQWQMDTDFNSATPRKIEADNSEITVGSVTVDIDGEEYTYSEISIPISNMLTEELVALLNGVESAIIAGELCGFDGTGALVFILQVKGFTVRGRISDIGTPTELPVEYLTAAQVRALVNSGFDVVFCETASTTASDWHSTQTSADRYMKFRLAGDASAAWSDIVGLIVGPAGDDGTSAYVYVAYASDDTGSDFSLIPSDSLPYRAEIHTDEPIVSPSASDFSGATWVKYLGRFDDTSFLTFDSVNASGKAVFSTDLIPFALKTNKGTLFQLEKGSVTLGSGSVTLDVAPYLAYDNSASFTGTWTLFFAAGSGGSQIQGVIPGTVHAFAGAAENIPSGYLLCNGAAVSRTDYADLYAAIGTIYGTGDGSTTFNLPDFRGKFLRGYLDGTSAALGTAQGDAIRNLTAGSSMFLSGATGAFSDYGTGMLRLSSTSWVEALSTGETRIFSMSFSLDASREVPTAAENRPVNYAVNFIIKY